MRNVFSKNQKSINLLIGACAIVFVTTKILNIWFGVIAVENNLYLSESNLLGFKIWTIVTYSFLHGSLVHLIINSILLYTVGNFLLAYELSTKKFYSLYFSCVVVGGLVWMLVNGENSALVGASAGVAGLLIFFCHSYSEKTLTLLLFFVFPINIKAKWCGYIFWWYEVATFLLYELPGISNIASSAHLGGMVVGFAFFKLVKSDFSSLKIPVPKKKFTGQYNVNIIHFRTESEKTNEQKTIFEVVKKLQESGISSLTSYERDILQKYESEKL